MKASKNAILIGRNDTANLFSIFGFITYSIDQKDIAEILKGLEQNVSSIGLIFVTSEVSLTEKQQRTLDRLDVPLLTVPVHPEESDISRTQFERLVERAVGMKMDFLQE